MANAHESRDAVDISLSRSIALLTNQLFWSLGVRGMARLAETTFSDQPIVLYDVNGEPLFPFGHGLSYTTFKYSGLKLSANKIKADGQMNVSLDVTNTGKRTGDEVVQLYVHEERSSVKVPVEELRGFQRVSLKSGEKQTVTFTLPAAKLAIWDETTHGFVVEPGAFDVMVGASSADIRLKDQVEVVR